jgi:hypothetical protein
MYGAYFAEAIGVLNGCYEIWVERFQIVPKIEVGSLVRTTQTAAVFFEGSAANLG